MKAKFITCFVVVFVLCSTGTFAQTTYNVDPDPLVGDFNTIQDCIDATVTGDTCQVNEGTYAESIDFSGKDITVVSTSGPDVTTIDPNWDSPVVWFHNGETRDARLDGFTITNTTLWFDLYGILCEGSSPTISNCKVHGFWGQSSSMGIRILGASAFPMITDCEIYSNNFGIFINASSATITNCMVYENTNIQIGILDASYITITNCTITLSYAHYQGLLYASDTFFIRVTNSILWAFGGEPVPVIYFDNNTHESIGYSDVWGGYAGTGNIDADPLFTDAANGHFHLQSGSPCIDTGTNFAAEIPPLDFEGDPRIVDGDLDGTAVVDMGADEATIGFPCACSLISSSPLEGIKRKAHIFFNTLPYLLPVGLVFYLRRRKRN